MAYRDALSNTQIGKLHRKNGPVFFKKEISGEKGERKHIIKGIKDHVNHSQ